MEPPTADLADKGLYPLGYCTTAEDVDDWNPQLEHEFLPDFFRELVGCRSTADIDPSQFTPLLGSGDRWNESSCWQGSRKAGPIYTDSRERFMGVKWVLRKKGSKQDVRVCLLRYHVYCHLYSQRVSLRYSFVVTKWLCLILRLTKTGTMVWHGMMAWYSMTWHGMVWHGIAWYGME